MGLTMDFGRFAKPFIVTQGQGYILEVQDGANPVGEFVGSIFNS
jgi:hypothetical protein